MSFAQRFSISGTQIKNPGGAEFIPIGANISGWNYHDWVHNAVVDADVIEQAWKFNIIRANIYLKATRWNGALTNGGKTWRNNTAECTAALDAIVNQFTAKKIVVMLEVHDWTCTYPTTPEDLQLLNDFWSWAANRYKSNSYVWFNIMNEPQWDTNNGNASYSWVTTNRPIIQVIRDQNVADNIIIVDGVNCGQESQTWNNNPIPSAQSAIITYGNDLKTFNNKTYANIGFNFHLYGVWGLNNTQSDTKLTDYITRVHNLGHCIFIGEVGATGLDDTHQVENTGSAYRAALLGKKVGMLAWHWNPKDRYRLTSEGSGAAINSWTNPTNLSSWAGKYFWDATHKDGFGLNTGSVLPIFVEFFKGRKEVNNNILNWKINCVGTAIVKIIVERSNDGQRFSLLNEQITTEVRCLQDFIFTDKNPLTSNNYYRLKTISPDGKILYSSIVALFNKVNGFELISVAPNPVRAHTNINITTVKGGNFVLNITDIAGKNILRKAVFVQEGNSFIDVDFSAFDAGAYMVVVTNTAGENKTIRIVKY